MMQRQTLASAAPDPLHELLERYEALERRVAFRRECAAWVAMALWQLPPVLLVWVFFLPLGRAGFFALLALTLALAVALLRLRRRDDRRRTRLLDALVGAAQDARGGGDVGPLLEIVARLSRDDAYSRPLADALTQLLARLTDSDARALTPRNQRLLRQIVTAEAHDTHAYPPELAVAALVVLASARDWFVRTDARWLARHHPAERLRAAAHECLRIRSHPLQASTAAGRSRYTTPDS